MKCAMYFTISDSVESASGHVGSAFMLDSLWLEGVAILNTGSVAFQQISTYPNPVTDIIHLPASGEGDWYSLTDQTGKSIRSGLISSSVIRVDGIDDGLYFLTVRKGKTNYLNKIIIAGN
jgi:hypothetical protein